MGMFHIGVRERLVVTNYGFILCPVISFILDLSVASDEGFKHIGYGPCTLLILSHRAHLSMDVVCLWFRTWTGFQYALSCLIGGNFLRFQSALSFECVLVHFVAVPCVATVGI